MKLKNVLIALSFVVLSPSLPVQYVNAQETPHNEFVAPIPYHPSPMRVKDFIIQTAMSYGFSVQTALSISEVESRFDSEAKNASSTASGIFQFLDGTFKYYCIQKYQIADSMDEKNDYHAQTLCAVRILKDGGIDNWSASRVLWQPLLASS